MSRGHWRRRGEAARRYVKQAPSAAPAPFSPLDLNPEGWWRADFRTLNGADVSALPNQGTGGSALDFLQSTASAQPLWVANDANFNNKPTVQSDGTEFMATVAQTVLDLADDGEISIIAVCRSTAAAEDGIWGDNGGSKGMQLFRRSGGAFRSRVRDDSGTSLTLTNGGIVALNTVHVMRMLFKGAVGPSLDTLSVWLDGVSGGSVTGNLGVVTNFACALFAKTSTGGNTWTGEWAESFAKKAELTAGQLDSLRDYYNTEYGLALSAV